MADVSHERPFGIDELFFSTTDEKGVIRSGNDVFSRVAGYAEDELVGRAHNVIRHPDTPRAVFQLLWDEIGAGRSVAAYVKNRSKDGGFYWVMASVVPVPGGYLSVRLKPSSELFPVVRTLYKELRTLELSIETGPGKARKRAIDASLELLGRRLPELGFADYASFMRAALPAELAAREGARSAPPPARADATGVVADALDAAGSLLRFLDGRFANLNAYVALNGRLADKSGFVGELAASIRLFSLNALLAATKLGDEGAALSAVADLMGERSVRVESVLGNLTASIATTVSLLTDLVFDICATKLQTEMTLEFARELAASGSEESRHRADLATLSAQVSAGCESVIASLAALEGRLAEIALGAARLTSELDVLRALQMNGRIEAAALGGVGDVEALFARVRETLVEAARETDEIRTVATGERARTGETREVRGSLEQLTALAA